MRKLKLDPEALRVESFAALPEGAAEAGTVYGRRLEPGDVHGKCTLDHTDCPIASCTCSNGDPFTECDCETVSGAPATA